MTTDVMVIGAGAAGLGAARELLARGRSFQILEAKPRAGGRAFTDRASLGGLPFDRGCQWLHSGDTNVLTPMAEAAGFTVERGAPAQAIWLGDGWADGDELSEYGRDLQRGLDAGEAAGARGEDRPSSDCFDVSSRWWPAIDRFFAAIYGVRPKDHSTLDAGRYDDTGLNFRVREGLGTVVERLASGLTISLSTPVRRIEWAGKWVRAHTPGGVVEARTAILTVPIAVLQAGRIELDPPLPREKQKALAAIDPGAANKVGLTFRDPLLEDLADGTLLFQTGGRLGYEVRPCGHDFILGYVAGPFAVELEQEGPDALIAVAVSELGRIVGRDLSSRLQYATATSWLADRFIGGAYSALRPGGGDARVELARPLAGRLFFAGEATSSDAFGTAHGAFESGRRAAQEALQALERSC